MRSCSSKPICTLPYLFWIATLILPITGRAQQSELQRVDSLRAVWMSPPGSIPDSVRLQAALLVASRYSDINYDSLVEFSRQMEEYGTRTGNRIWLAYANNYCMACLSSFTATYWAALNELCPARILTNVHCLWQS